MSTPRTPNQKKQYAALNARLNKYAKLVEQLYAKYNREAAAIALRTDYLPDDGKMFRFKDYPHTRAAINDLLLEYANDIIGTIHRGTAYEWQQSNTFQDLLANKVLRAYGISNPKTKEYQHYFQTNSDQLKAFQQRQISGMNLSQRVWDLRSQYKEELEMALSVGIEQGISANALASQMKKYLNDPDKLFRRVRDEFGNLQLSKNAKAYHPGRGVYRSSFKNAQRLTRSEINMAYRTAEQTRWRQFDFVVGYEIKLSQRHPCHDVCDELAGRYPKDFVWTGWHPNDMCYAVSILKTDEEFWRDLAQDPDEPKEPSVNEVSEVPDGFKEWVSDNADRIEAAEKRGTQPYFIRDNREAVDEVLKPREEKNVLELAEERHAARTPEGINRIQKKWNDNRLDKLMVLSERIGSYRDKNLRYMFSLLADENSQSDFSAFKNDYILTKKYINDTILQETHWASSLRNNPQFKSTLLALEKAFGKVGEPMTYYEANIGRENPNYNISVGYKENCQTCTLTHWLRRLGFDVTAKPNDKTENNIGTIYQKLDELGINWKNRFINMDNSNVNYDFTSLWKITKGYNVMTPKRVKEYLSEKLSTDGLYEVYCGWKYGNAHVFCAEVQNGNIHFFDPQSGQNNVSDYIQQMKGDAIGVIRIDDKKINPHLAVLFNLAKKR